MKKLLLLICFTVSYSCGFSQATIIKYLSGPDKDHTVQWDFYCTGGRNSGKWTKIAVPSNWELQGFGTYNYGRDKVKANEQGLYKYQFNLEKRAGKKVFIVFEGSMTDTKVMVNGKQAGPLHQGSFYRFKYDITNLLKTNGKNLLEVTVDKTSENASVNDAERDSDFWIFGGIFRPVYLEIVPETFINRIAINAKADGSFAMDVFPKNTTGNETIEAQVKKLNGENVGKPFSIAANKNEEVQTLKSSVAKPLLWSAEFPNLYKVVVSIKSKQKIVHQVIQKFGFRTVELRLNDGLYVNGSRVILKGSNRHSFWPESGRTLSHTIHLMDVDAITQMNMNAVRMSHYPPDQDFLDVCDSIGLYVLDELTGWQKKYDTTVGRKLVKELVVRDVNHPSIIFWDNGNEGGWNTGLDNDYDLYDPQKRTVIHPWEKFNGTDTHHYPDYKSLSNAAATGQEVYFPTELLHGLYDGGAGAGLDDFWKVILNHPHAAGGFIWALVDEDVIRTDKNGIYDGDGNHAPDGILGPHREKEGSFYTIKEIWAPVYIETPAIDENFDGTIQVENRYAFANLNQCSFKWKLVDFPKPSDNSTTAVIKQNGSCAAIDIKPGDKGLLKINLPASWKKNAALYLTAYGPDKKEIFTWSWPLKSPAQFCRQLATHANKSVINVEETDRSLMIKGSGADYYFDKTTGYIQKVISHGKTISLSDGPMLAGVKTTLKNFKHNDNNGTIYVEAEYEGEASLHVKWIFAPGQPAQLDYQYSQQGEVDFMGITFNYPEEKITGMKWLGRGPYRVWKNRLKGQQFGVWQKGYNNTITGETWNYPEFKGYHAEVNWVTIENKELPFTICTPDADVYFQMLKPARVHDAPSNNYVEPAFATASLGFLNAISAIGTKFHAAETMGPQGQKNKANGEQVNGTLWFNFNQQ